jgi:hypothetical protein
LRRKSITKDEDNKTVSYTYDWDNECGPGLVEISVEKSRGPDNCDHWESTVEISVQGNGCDSATMLANAETALSTVVPANYAPVGSCQKSYRENRNVTRGNIRRSYTYTTECDATLDVTITEIFDQQNCEDSAHSVSGEIKGHCYTGGMTAAEALYLSHGPDAYADGSCLVSSRVARNERSNTIRFDYEFKSCDDGYEHEQTIATKTDDQDCCTDVTISGTITPFCDPDTGEAGLVATAEAAWTTIEATLEALAQSYCSHTVKLRATNVSRNQKTGVITYSYNYQCCDTCIDGVLKESINITREFPADVVAIVPILGRACGPIIQDKGTKTVEKCSIAIDLQFEKECGCSFAKPAGLEANVQGIISSAGCCADAYGTHLERDTESWNPRTGRYTRNVTYICECC